MKKYTLILVSCAILVSPMMSFANSTIVEDTSPVVDPIMVIDTIHPSIGALMNRYNTVVNGEDAKSELETLRKQVGEKAAQKIEERVYEIATKIIQKNLDNTKKSKDTLFKLGDTLNKKVTQLESKGLTGKKLAAVKLLLQEITIAYIAIENQYIQENPEAPIQ